jgi:hypothetical protein
VISKLFDTTLDDLDSIFQLEVVKELRLGIFHFVGARSIKKNLADGYQKMYDVKDERNRNIFDPAGGLYANTVGYSKF